MVLKTVPLLCRPLGSPKNPKLRFRNGEVAIRPKVPYKSDMSGPIRIALIVIFSIHLIVFLYLYVRRRNAYFLCVASAFMWLVLYQVARLWWVDVTLFGYSAGTCFRLAAWLTTGFGVLVYLRNKRLLSREP